MTVQMPLASAEAVRAGGSGRVVQVQRGPAGVVDHAEAGPIPLELMPARSRPAARCPPARTWSETASR